MRQNVWLNLFLFFMGAASLVRVQLIGMIGISEIIICLLAPYMLIRNFSELRRDGFLLALTLMFFACIGCLVGGAYNQTPATNLIRGFATPVVLLCSVIFYHGLLRNNLNAYKWLAVGFAISVSLSQFFNGVSVEDVVNNDIHAGIGGSDYMLTVILAPLFYVPVILFYRHLPWFLSASLYVMAGVFTVMTSVSGRSAAMGAFGAGVLIWIGKKSVRNMGKVKRHFLLYIVLAVVCLLALKTGYSVAAKSGVLGESAQQKYVEQTRGNDSTLGLLMGGRSEVFIGLYAVLHQPIVGFGPWAVDWNGYEEEFRQKYGLYDYEEAAKTQAYLRQLGMNPNIRFIPAHSHIVGSWLWYGIFGLIMWCYFLYLIFRFFKEAPDVLPQWWPLLVIAMPSRLWHIFFSPFSHRSLTGAIICALLLAIGIGRRKIRMDRAAQEERSRYLP